MKIAKNIAAWISSSPKRYLGYFVPVFKIRCDDTPYHAGTAFGIEHEGKRYMVTAAHVLDRDENNPCDSENELFVGARGSLTQIGKFDISKINVSASSPSARRPLDLVLISPHDVDLSDVFTHFFTDKQFDKSRLRVDLYVAACGFPATKNRANRYARTLSRYPVGYFGRVSTPAKCRRAGFDPRTHFCFDIFLKKVFTGSQKEIKAPKPHGISGGPVFVVHNFRRPMMHMMPKLRGIVVESAPEERAIVCIDLFAVLSQANFVDRVLYFAYGSNMAIERLYERVPSAKFISVAALSGYTLRFHKPSKKDGSGKCDAAFTGNSSDTVLGVLYSINADQLSALDKYEGLGHGYDRKTVPLITCSGEIFQAETYIATNRDPSLRPLDWYKEHVLRGARAIGLPSGYIASIEAVVADFDVDKERRMNELEIYSKNVPS